MEGSEDRLRAFCSITLDHCFVVRDLKVIDGASGPFVAMPSRKLSGHCYRCNYKNHLRAAYCNQCGAKLKVSIPADLPQKLYADVAHPVNSECREMISSAVLTEFENELARAAEPGYRSRYDDDFDAIAESSDEVFPAQTGSSRGPRPRAEGTADRPGPTVRVDSPHAGSDRRRGEAAGDVGESIGGNTGPVPPPHLGENSVVKPESVGETSTRAEPSAGEGETGDDRNSRAAEADSRGVSDRRVPGTTGRIDTGHSEKRTRPLDERLGQTDTGRQTDTGFGSGIFD
jgi:stage V sporulation protein G